MTAASAAPGPPLRLSIVLEWANARLHGAHRRVRSIVDPERALRPVNPHHFYWDGALHDPVKSREELLRKARLEREKRRYDGVDDFAYHDRNEVFDPILAPWLPALERELTRLGRPGSLGPRSPERG